MITRILSLGAGVQSTTIALMGVANWEYWHCSEPLPYPKVGLIDYAVFADTQEEPRAVYRHLEWLRPQCEKFFPVLVRTAGKLGDDLIQGIPVTAGGLHERRFPSIPALLERGILPRQCTRDYKIDIIERTIRREILGLAPKQRMPKESDVMQLIGLSYDEGGRIMRVRARPDNPFELKFPLFEMEMTRGGCKTWLAKQKIPHEVPRSACVFCPYHSNAEWRRIKEVPQDWARAIQIDRALRDSCSRCSQGRDQMAYVHRDCVPLEQANLDDPETKERKKGQEMFGFLAECEGMCGV